MKMMQIALRAAKRRYHGYKKARILKRYERGGRLPHSPGYGAFKFDYIARQLADATILELFRESRALPSSFGWRLDERAVEYPWVCVRLSEQAGRFLDAGSTFNFEALLPFLHRRGKDVTIFTLAPEGQCFWRQRVSYQFGDLREMPFRDEWFDEIVCISTLEHIGMDNRRYGSDKVEQKKDDFVLAAQELLRVLKPGGKLLITVPYGKRQEVAWKDVPFMQQFDAAMLRELQQCFAGHALESRFYKYSSDGWNIATQDECAGAEYFYVHARPGFDPDYAAAARAIACLEVVKAPAH